MRPAAALKLIAAGSDLRVMSPASAARLPADRAARYGLVVVGRRREKLDWKHLEGARIARARTEYRRTRPGERVEQAIELSRAVTELAARRQLK